MIVARIVNNLAQLLLERFCSELMKSIHAWMAV